MHLSLSLIIFSFFSHYSLRSVSFACSLSSLVVGRFAITDNGNNSTGSTLWAIVLSESSASQFAGCEWQHWQPGSLFFAFSSLNLPTEQMHSVLRDVPTMSWHFIFIRMTSENGLRGFVFASRCDAFLFLTD